MLATLLVWLYTSALCYVYGFLFLKRLRIQADFPAVPLIVIAGLVVLTALASFFSLFFQIGLFFNLILCAGAIGAILTHQVPLPRIGRPAALLPFVVLVPALLLILENATHRPLNPDTNIYHAQAIHWIESFPAVPGLGNLHGRLAFNSAWFVSNALFSLAFLGLRSFHLTAAFLFLAVLLYFWGGFAAIARGEYKASTLLKVLFFPLAFSLLGAEISSPGTDLPVSLLLWLMVVLWAEHSEQEQPFHPILIVILAAFALTVKLSAAPVLLFILFIFARVLKKNFSVFSVYSVANPLICAALIIIPFLARNVILSGYLLYPVPSINLFSFDWKVPLERAANEQMSILAWGRFPRIDAAQVLAMPFGEWFPQWLDGQTLNRRVLLFGALFSFLAAIPALLANIDFQKNSFQVVAPPEGTSGRCERSVSQRSRSDALSLPKGAMTEKTFLDYYKSTRSYWLAWLTCWLGILFWLFNAPDFRFGYGFLIATLALALAPWCAAVLQRTTFPAMKVSAILSLLVVAYLGFTLAASFEARTFAERLLLPADYDRVPTQSCNIANGTISCAKAYDACAYNAFPCIPSPRPWLELRNPPSLRDGFRAAP